ncbi:MAG: polysaccharide biosynthesis C-terminal domain-containing protein, partial [Clostridium sp.]|nr:polysaccharide biosynthesis C-terminal domain-containing protein [Clostridium sp.]
VTAVVLNMALLKRTLSVKFDLYQGLIKPAYASIIMIVTVVFIYVKVYNYTMSNSISCLIAILVGIIVYIILVLMFKVVDYNELARRRSRR